MPTWSRNERPMKRYAPGSKLENAPTGGALPALTALHLEDEAGAVELHARLRVRSGGRTRARRSAPTHGRARPTEMRSWNVTFALARDLDRARRAREDDERR